MTDASLDFTGLRALFFNGSGGAENDFTNRNTTFMTWNLMHAERLPCP